jgi:hypothetical protein
MIRSAIRFVTLSMFLAALVAAAPVIPALAAGGIGGRVHADIATP